MQGEMGGEEEEEEEEEEEGGSHFVQCVVQPSVKRD